MRPHELEILAEPDDDTWPVTPSQILTVGPNTRIEFKRLPDDSYGDVELPRGRMRLEPGSRVHLRPRRVTRFGAAEAPSDPAAAI